MMRTNDHYFEYLALILRDEGLRNCVYDDATGTSINSGDAVQGHPTIGVGERCDRGSPIESELLELIALYRIDQYVMELNKLPFWSGLSYTRRAVLIGMMHNVGINGFFEFQNMISAIYAQHYTRAALEIVDSKARQQNPERYERYAQMMQTDKMDKLTMDIPSSVSPGFVNFMQNIMQVL